MWGIANPETQTGFHGTAQDPGLLVLSVSQRLQMVASKGGVCVQSMTRVVLEQGNSSVATQRGGAGENLVTKNSIHTHITYIYIYI